MVKLAEKFLDNSNVSYRIEVNLKNLDIVKNFEKAIGFSTEEIVFLVIKMII